MKLLFHYFLYYELHILLVYCITIFQKLPFYYVAILRKLKWLSVKIAITLKITMTISTPSTITITITITTITTIMINITITTGFTTSTSSIQRRLLSLSEL